jgi:hypothetical protein
MKRANVKQRRTHRDGRRLVNVNCPQCGHRHWITATTDPVFCPLRPTSRPSLIGGQP